MNGSVITSPPHLFSRRQRENPSHNGCMKWTWTRCKDHPNEVPSIRISCVSDKTRCCSFSLRLTNVFSSTTDLGLKWPDLRGSRRAELRYSPRVYAISETVQLSRSRQKSLSNLRRNPTCVAHLRHCGVESVRLVVPLAVRRAHLRRPRPALGRPVVRQRPRARPWPAVRRPRPRPGSRSRTWSTPRPASRSHPSGLVRSSGSGSFASGPRSWAGATVVTERRVVAAVVGTALGLVILGNHSLFGGRPAQRKGQVNSPRNCLEIWFAQ